MAIKEIKSIRISKEVHEDFIRFCGAVQKARGIKITADLGMKMILNEFWYNPTLLREPNVKSLRK